jgi:hypothetical protein
MGVPAPRRRGDRPPTSSPAGQPLGHVLGGSFCTEPSSPPRPAQGRGRRVCPCPRAQVAGRSRAPRRGY